MAAVAKEQLKSPRARLFVALDLPEATREGLVAWGEEALADPALRSVAAESLHITLAFLGHRPEQEIEAIADVMRESIGPAPWVELRDPEQRPSRGRARLFALPAISPGAEALQAGLQQRLVNEGFYEPEKRPFWPHVTVARVRSEAGDRGGRRSSRSLRDRSRRSWRSPGLLSGWLFIVLNSSQPVRAMCRWPKSSCPEGAAVR